MIVYVLSRCERHEGGSVISAHRSLNKAKDAAGHGLEWTPNVGARGAGLFWTADADTAGVDYFKIEELDVLP